MRSLSVTLLFGLVALISMSVAAIRMSDGSLSRILGAPPNEVGSALYDFNPENAETLHLQGNGVAATAVKKDGLWHMEQPWEDRMDPRALQKLFQFTLNTRVESAIPADKVKSLNLGFDDGRIGLRIGTGEGDPLAKYMLGHRTAWVGTDSETGESIPTVFLQPRDKHRKDYLYACTDRQDIHTVLGDGFKRLRDHHPFLFHPTAVQSVRIGNRSGDMRLSREASNELWRIVKPLGLQADRDALVELIQGLYDLKALNVRDRSKVTLPGSEDETLDEIALSFFKGSEETVLRIYPPESEDARTTLATVSDRPTAVFELPRTTMLAPDGSGELVGLRDLPLSVNELRDPTLTDIDVRAVKTILISPADGRDVRIRRGERSGRFALNLDGREVEANEEALYTLLKTVTESEVQGFVSDSATDLEPYGLANPFLVIQFEAFDDTTIRLDFGQAEDGAIHAIRHGTTTVVEIAPSMLALIPTRPWEWRDTKLWRISATDVKALARFIRGRPPVELGYDFVPERWTARVGDEDRTTDVVKERADHLLEKLLALRVDHWLPPGHSGALEALESPDMRLVLQFQKIDEKGEFAGVDRRELTIARAGSGRNSVIYAGASDIPTPFLLAPEDLEALRVDLFESD